MATEEESEDSLQNTLPLPIVEAINNLQEEMKADQMDEAEQRKKWKVCAKELYDKDKSDNDKTPGCKKSRNIEIFYDKTAGTLFKSSGDGFWINQ